MAQVAAVFAPAPGGGAVFSGSQLNPVKWKYSSGATYDSSYGGKTVTASNLSVTADTNSVFSQFVLSSVTCSTSTTNKLTFARKYTIYPQGKIFSLFSVSAGSSIDTMMPGAAMARKNNGSDSLIPYWGSGVDKRIGGFYDTAATRANHHGVAFGYLSYQRGGVKGPSATTLVDAGPSWMNLGGEKKILLQDSSTRYKTDSIPYRMALYYDISREFRSAAHIDTVIKDALYTNCITAVIGKKDSTTVGDLDSNGYNEAEGYWAIQAPSNPVNTVHFKLGIDADVKVHYYPTFKITNYHSTEKPQYVFMAESQAQDPNTATRLLEGYGYTAYLNSASSYLLVQLDTVIRNDSAYVFISCDRTLAVTMDNFWASGGDNCDTVYWKTESEQENLGFILYRRIKPQFMDSLMKVASVFWSRPDSELTNAGMLMKKQAISMADTGWVPVFHKMIPGAKGGTSYAQQTYRIIDRKAQNDLLYQYRLMAVDFKNKEDQYKTLAEAMPRIRIPTVFALHGNYPNPFRFFTTIRYDLPKKVQVTLNIYNTQGRLVRHLMMDRRHKPGYHEIKWDGRDDFNRSLGAGPYIYQIKAGEYRKAKLMILVR
jgi:hypothetical protein